MGVCDHRHARWADLLERSRRRGARGHRRRGLQRVLRFADGHGPRIQSGGSASDVERRDVARHRRVRGSAGRGDLPRGSRRLAHSRFRLAGRHGRDLLCRTPHPLGLSRPGGARHRVVVRAVDGAGQRLSLHRRAFPWGALFASLVPGFLIMSLAVVNAIPDFHQDRWSASAISWSGGAPARRRALSRSRDGGAWRSCPSASSPGCFPPRALPRFSRLPLLVASARQCRPLLRIAAPLRARHPQHRALLSRRDGPLHGGHSASPPGGSDESPHRRSARTAVRFLADHPRLRSLLSSLLHRVGAGEATGGRARRRRSDAAGGRDRPQRRAVRDALRRRAARGPAFLRAGRSARQRGRHAQDRDQRPALRRGGRRSASRAFRSAPSRSASTATRQETYERQRPGRLARQGACGLSRGAGAPACRSK